MSLKVETIAVQPWRLSVGDFIALAKPRLNALVVASAAVGYWLGAGTSRSVLLITMIGTVLAAAGASALNQLLERDIDGRMYRTRLRPLPDGRLADLPLLPVIDRDGRRTARHVLLFTSALVPATLLPSIHGDATTLYGAEALVLTTAFLLTAIRFARRRDLSGARWLFAASLLDLPLLWVALLAGRLPAR